MSVTSTTYAPPTLASLTQSFKNESIVFPGKPEEAYYGMLARYDDVKVGKQETKTCPEPGCNYASSNKSDLKDHINSRHIHFPASKCELCAERFFTKRNYNRHRRSHHLAELTLGEAGKRDRDVDDGSDQNHKLILPLNNESTIFLGNPRDAYNAMLTHYKRLKFSKSEQIKCPERNCNYYCNNKTDLQGHINSRHIHCRVVECEACREWFFTQKAAHSHRKNRHPELGDLRNEAEILSNEDEEDSGGDSSECENPRKRARQETSPPSIQFRVPFTHLPTSNPRQQELQLQLEKQAQRLAASQFQIFNSLNNTSVSGDKSWGAGSEEDDQEQEQEDEPENGSGNEKGDEGEEGDAAELDHAAAGEGSLEPESSSELEAQVQLPPKQSAVPSFQISGILDLGTARKP